ncbi:MAG: thiamine phosphate synthase [Alphaproteobacteria bacterium]|nr:thiamine phosphate synthase [Alphaproteobacteria bacterium]
MPKFIIQVIFNIGKPNSLGTQWLRAAHKCLEGGADAIQVRVDTKYLSTEYYSCEEDVSNFMRDISKICAKYSATAVVNDFVDIAARSGSGVWLGQSDTPLLDARKILGPNSFIGITCDSRADLAQAQAADMASVVLKPSDLNPNAVPVLNPDVDIDLALNQLVESSPVPLIALSGAGSMIPQLVHAGFGGAAFSRTVTEAHDPCLEVNNIAKLIQDAQLTGDLFCDVVQ